MLGVFGFLALGLASVGLYGVMADGVNRRQREIGLRMALGAPATSVSRMVLKQGMTLVGIGVALGLAASLLIGQALTRFAAGMSTHDPIGLAEASLTLIAVAVLACYLPARRASRLDPIVALRAN
jgi:ABC-type antimicrobial peptide transport system permease subunit